MSNEWISVLETEFTQFDINMALADKINELVDAVNRLGAEVAFLKSKKVIALIGREDG